MTSKAKQERLVSLDQFRGYTVVGMLVVNYLGSYQVVPAVLKHHHTYCSYADTIMPHFLFAVGFAYRLTFLRRLECEGAAAAYRRVIRRLVGLLLVALMVHSASTVSSSWSELKQMGLFGALWQPVKREWFQTLTHIAVTSLWITPVVGRSLLLRSSFAIGSLILHVLLSAWFNFSWTWTSPMSIDGGPWGFLTWSTAAVGGTIAYDIVAKHRAVIPQLLKVGVAMMAVGWLLSCGTRYYDADLSPKLRVAWRPFVGHPDRIAENPVFPWFGRVSSVFPGLAEPPFVAPPDNRQYNYWMMSQRAATATYLIFATGFSFAVYALFYWLCDRHHWSLGIFDTFGSNALAAYVIHSIVDSGVSPFVPGDAPAWYVTVSFAMFLGISYLFVRSLQKQGIFLRL